MEGFVRERAHNKTDLESRTALIRVVDSDQEVATDNPNDLRVLVIKDSLSLPVFVHTVIQKSH